MSCRLDLARRFGFHPFMTTINTWPRDRYTGSGGGLYTGPGGGMCTGPGGGAYAGPAGGLYTGPGGGSTPVPVAASTRGLAVVSTLRAAVCTLAPEVACIRRRVVDSTLVRAACTRGLATNRIAVTFLRERLCSGIWPNTECATWLNFCGAPVSKLH